MTDNKTCNHNFGSWKKNKKPLLDCESIGEEDYSFLKECYKRKCKECGFVETRYEIANRQKAKKTKNKHLSLRMDYYD